MLMYLPFSILLQVPVDVASPEMILLDYGSFGIMLAFSIFIIRYLAKKDQQLQEKRDIDYKNAMDRAYKERDEAIKEMNVISTRFIDHMEDNTKQNLSVIAENTKVISKFSDSFDMFSKSNVLLASSIEKLTVITEFYSKKFNDIHK